MSARSWASQLAQAAYERGWLTSAAQKKSLMLIESGLHPEQVFIGMGLLSAQQYAECVQMCWGITIERLDMDAWSIVGSSLSDGVIEGENESGERQAFRADGWDSTSALSVKNVKDVYYSDLIQWCRQPEPVDLSVSEWLEAWSTVDATEVRLGVEQHRGVVQAGVTRTYLDDGCIKPEEVPALQAWFEGGFGSRDWSSERTLGIESDWLVLVAKHSRHPLKSLEAWQTFLEKPLGVLYLIDPDEWLRRQVSHLAELRNHSEVFQSTGLYRCEPQSAAEREVALHSALAGTAVCWVDEGGASAMLLRQLAAAGIPVKLVRGRATNHGTAWEVYQLSL